MDEIVGEREVAERLKDMRCPVEDCGGTLLRFSDYFSGQPYTDRFGHHVPHAEIPKFGIGCDGPVMHVFLKLDLIKLKPNLVKTVGAP
jgi:hypothetical protein